MVVMRLFTIGYEGAEIADFLATLTACGISQVLDVREIPISRKRGFSKNRLKDALSECGIEYLHLKALGDPKPGRIAARAGKFATFEAIYRKHLGTAEAQAALEIAQLAALRQVSCLLCFERSSENCHRSIIAERMAAVEKFEIHHIGVRAPSSSWRKAVHDKQVRYFALG